MKWDAAAILLHVILGMLDLVFRMKISMVQASMRAVGGWSR